MEELAEKHVSLICGYKVDKYMKLHKHCTLDTSTVAKQNKWEMRNGNYPYIHKYTCHYLHLHTGVCESLHHPKRWKLLDFICVLVDAKRLGRGKSASLESTSQCWGRTRASCLQLHTSWAKVPLWVWRLEMPWKCLYPFQNTSWHDCVPFKTQVG